MREALACIALCVGGMQHQVAHHRYYLFESCDSGRAWHIEDLRELLNHFGWSVPVACCAVGLRDVVSGDLFGKMRFCSNSYMIMLKLSTFQCTGGHVHEVVQGSSGGVKRSVQSQKYTPRLCHAILQGMVIQLEVDEIQEQVGKVRVLLV